MRRLILYLTTFQCLLCVSTWSHKWHDFREKVIEHKMCVLISSSSFIWSISHSTKNWAYWKIFTWSSRCFCHILRKRGFSWQMFEKYSDIKFYENLSSENWVVACGRTDGRTDGWTYWHDELRVTFRNFANAPKTACRKVTDAQTATSAEHRSCLLYKILAVNQYFQSR
jgi:hypothetical protein